MNQTLKATGFRSGRAGRRDRRSVVVGLLNNMPDGALQPTEQQFRNLLSEAAPPDVELKWRYFSLQGVERSEAARAHMLGRYEHIDELPCAGVDALIVTGAEPRTDRLDEEAYWPDLARVIDWTRSERVPTVWSCLAAHAAVLRLGGVSRHRLPAKHSGVFGLQIATGHPLLKGAPSRVFAPHSRLNDLGAREVELAGYEIVARSPDVGVDTFLGPALGVFFQGHPEYDAGALEREYLRDVSRFLRGHQANHPLPPTGYFGPDATDALQGLSELAMRTHDAGLIDAFAKAVHGRTPQATWRPWALHIYRWWLRQVSQPRVRGSRLSLT